ncbi:MAG: PilZ domain-containing protein, partial [Fimbriimonadales bacterium]|nr:PilZ domain-containing protein [Fimbriimonadales bacterium]
ALLYKPFDIDTLLGTVRALLRRLPHLTPSHAVVSFADTQGDTAVHSQVWLEAGVLATLKAENRWVMGRILNIAGYGFRVETEVIEPPYPRRWIVEWTGSDALYQFRARVIDVLPQENSLYWTLQMPSLIRRLQRRRHLRMRVSGRAFVSIAGRLQRAIEAELVDLSEEGACIVIAEPPHRGAQVHLDVRAQTEVGSIAFQREGVVRSIVAFVEQGQPRYRVGIQLQRLPRSTVQQLHALRQQRLLHP